MSINTKKTKRVSLLLDQSEYSKLNSLSTKTGKPISSILREWIAAFNNKEIVNPNFITNSTNFTFRVTNSEYSYILSKSLEYKLNISRFIRVVIEANLSPVKKNLRIENIQVNLIKNLWRQGEFGQLIDYGANKLDQLSSDSLILFARAAANSGKFDYSKTAISILENKKTDKTHSALGVLTSADIAMYTRKLDSCNSKLLEFDNIDLQSNDSVRELIGLYKCQIGEAASYKENDLEAKKLFEEALDFVDIVNHPLTMTRIYLRLARVSLYLSEIANANKYYAKANYLNSITNNKFYKAWYYFDISVIQQMYETDYKISLSSMNKSLSYYKEIDNVRGEYYCLDNIGRIYLSNQDIDIAYHYLSKGEMLERNTVNSQSFSSHVKFFLWFLESKNNYTRSITQMEDALSKVEIFRPSSMKYVYFLTKFVNGNAQDQILGEQGLKQLIEEDTSPMISYVANKSLISRKFEVFR